MRFSVAKVGPRPGPGAARMGLNLANAAGRAAIAAVKRAPVLRSKEAAEGLLAICQACPGGWFDKASARCLHKACGCPVRRKARVATETCPGGFWPGSGQGRTV